MKYFEILQQYLQLIADLRYDTFIKYVTDKKQAIHGLKRQGNEIPSIGDFVMIKDHHKHNYVKYGIILGFSKNQTKALVRTQKQPNGGWYVRPLIFSLVKI